MIVGLTIIPKKPSKKPATKKEEPAYAGIKGYPQAKKRPVKKKPVERKKYEYCFEEYNLVTVGNKDEDDELEYEFSFEDDDSSTYCCGIHAIGNLAFNQINNSNPAILNELFLGIEECISTYTARARGLVMLSLSSYQLGGTKFKRFAALLKKLGFKAVSKFLNTAGNTVTVYHHWKPAK